MRDKMECEICWPIMPPTPPGSRASRLDLGKSSYEGGEQTRARADRGAADRGGSPIIPGATTVNAHRPIAPAPVGL